jgi:hypothetical protein
MLLHLTLSFHNIYSGVWYGQVLDLTSVTFFFCGRPELWFDISPPLQLGELGKGAGKGGGGGGSVREAGGAFGKKQAAEEERYFR